MARASRRSVALHTIGVGNCNDRQTSQAAAERIGAAGDPRQPAVNAEHLLIDRSVRQSS
jgi:hypothetical protein